jgi:Tol biopolymer transport system component
MSKRVFAAILLAIAALAASSGALLARMRAPQQAPAPRNGSLPSVSRDGRYVAFARSTTTQANDIFVVGADGNGERRLASGAQTPPGWTTDGRVFWSTSAFMSDTTVLLAVAPTGGDPTPFQKFVGRDAAPMPEGDFIIATGKFPNMVPAHLPNGSVSSHPFPVPPGAYFNNAVSPDGRQVAFAHMDSARDMQIWLMNTNGTGLRQLTHFAKADGGPQWPTWSPDGKSLAVQAGVYDRNNAAANTAHIWLVDAATGNGTKLAAHGKPYLDETPSFFPDGKRIAFQSDRTGRMEVWVMNADGSGARQLTR